MPSLVDRYLVYASLLNQSAGAELVVAMQPIERTMRYGDTVKKYEAWVAKEPEPREQYRKALETLQVPLPPINEAFRAVERIARTPKTEMSGLMTLYTFVVEHNGGTELQQVEAGGVDAAAHIWNLQPPEPRIDPERLNVDSPAPVAGLRRVWCFSGLDADENLYLVHVIETGGD
jgi:hypothetical protein